MIRQCLGCGRTGVKAVHEYEEEYGPEAYTPVVINRCPGPVIETGVILTPRQRRERRARILRMRRRLLLPPPPPPDKDPALRTGGAYL